MRGLLLAVSTFAFGLAASQYFYNRPILSAGQVESVPFLRTNFFGLDVQSQRTYYYVVLVALVLAVMITSRLRRTGIGRTTIGVRDNPEGASGYTVEPDVGEAPHVRARRRDRRPRGRAARRLAAERAAAHVTSASRTRSCSWRSW